MKTLLINTLYSTLRWYVSSGVFDRLSTLVTQLISVDIPGSAKRTQVSEFLEKEFGLIWGEASGIVVDAVISITRLKYEARQKDVV
jgi:uncharacterized metal-binding protein